jgi:8-oxo-dGTP diphosphatase/2-hydroxy-dATP diphosphatase
MKQLTLCLIHQDSKLLLGLKKRGFGQGRWNGFGGKLNEKETIEEAAKRELKEESGIHAHELEKRGIIVFEFQDDQENLEVHIFHVTKFEGEPTESEEMKPEWFNVQDIPFKQMWADDKQWFPLFLEGKKFKGTFLLDGEKGNKIIKSELVEVTEI